MSVPALRFKDDNGSNYPNLIFSNLGIACQFQQGVQIDLELQVNVATDGYLRFLRIENYTQNSQDFRYIPAELSANKVIDNDEIAIVRYGATAGFIARGLSGVLANNLFKLIPDKSKLTNDYLFQYLRTNRVFSFFQSEMAGGAMPALSFGIVRNLELSIPCTDEQTKIANFLTAVDEKITHLTQKHDLLTQYKKGVMQQIFIQEIRFKDDDGQNFPEWEDMILSDVTEIIMGQSPDSSSYNDLSEGKPLIQGNADISNRKTSPRAWTTAPTKECKINDIILTVRAPVGAVAISLHDACIGRGVCAIRSNKKSITSYIYQLLLWFEPSKWVSLEQGSTFTAVNSNDVKTIDIPVPMLNEQTKIANFLTAIDDKITATQTQLKAVKQYKQGLLQQMFV